MSRFRIEWQMGGEIHLQFQDDHTASEPHEDGLSSEVLDELQSKADGIADYIAYEMGGDLRSGDATAEVTVRRLS